MDRGLPDGLDLVEAPTPCFIIDEDRLARNLAVLSRVKQATDCRILLALKAFAAFSVFPQLRRTLDGCCASSPFEARLAKEEFGGEVHAFAAAYSDRDILELAQFCGHVVFNSQAQLAKYRNQLSRSGVGLALRVNPEHSEVRLPIYDPCAPGSRLGVRRAHLEPSCLEGLEGLHFHTLCELGADALERTLRAFEEKFGAFVAGRKYVNFGGGHHITRPDYDVDLLIRLINDFKARHGVQVYLEPGEAAALDAGYLVATVLDVVEADMGVAIMDASVAAHMPDVLEGPYRPPLAGAGLPGEKDWTFRLAGLSCLAGDVAGEYSFDAPLQPGDKIAFLDQAHYTMVKTNTFNGVRLPSIGLFSKGEGLRIIREFNYNDFKSRLS
ncbi:MAG: carboxynorspermidine decarboxylase [Desulfovibrionales bacterium]|nr:carboxynorspermidine decarboxylase [Desulfovibrionales bacterium]